MSDRNKTALRRDVDCLVFVFGSMCFMILEACGSSNVIQDKSNRHQYTLVVANVRVPADLQVEIMAEAVMVKRGYTSYQLVDRRAALSETGELRTVGRPNS